MARTTAVNFSGALQFPKADAATDLFKKEDVQTLALAVDQHDHSSGKGLALPAGSITSAMIADGTIDTLDLKDGSVTSAKIADGTIATADLADSSISTAKIVPHAVTSAWRSPGVTSGPSTTSTTAVDMPEMAFNFTPLAIADVYVEFGSSIILTGAGAYSIFTSLLDGSPVGFPVYFQQTGVNGTVNIGFVLNSVSAALHTVKVQWQVSAGGAVTATATNRMLSLLVLQR